MATGLGHRAQGLGFRIQGFRVLDSGAVCRSLALVFRFQGAISTVKKSGAPTWGFDWGLVLGVMGFISV